MKVKWMLLNMVVAIGLASIAPLALAQERPADRPADTAGDRPGAPGEADGMDDLEDLDGLGMLLAAQAHGGPGAGGGPGHHAMMGQGMHGGPGMGPGAAGGDALHKKLNLTDDQKSKLADIHDRQARAAIPIQADLRLATLDLRKLMRADKPDPRAIDAQIDRIASLRASMQKSHVAGMLEARTVLTPAQQKLMREHRGGMMGRGMHGGRGMGRGQGMHGGPGMHEGPGMRMRHL